MNQPGPLTNRLKYFRPAANALTGSQRSVTGIQRSVTGSQRSVTGSQRSVTGSQRSVTGSQRPATGSQRSATGSHNSRLPGPLNNGLKYFRFWLRFRRVIQVFRD